MGRTKIDLFGIAHVKVDFIPAMTIYVPIPFQFLEDLSEVQILYNVSPAPFVYYPCCQRILWMPLRTNE